MDIKTYIQSLSPGVQSSLSEVYKLLKLILVMPATNAVSERSALALRRLKNYLKSTMTQSRLNNLMLLYVHKERLDKLCLKSCLNELINWPDHLKRASSAMESWSLVHETTYDQSHLFILIWSHGSWIIPDEMAVESVRENVCDQVAIESAQTIHNIHSNYSNILIARTACVINCSTCIQTP